MAGIAKPNIKNLREETIAYGISGIGDYDTNPLALFDGSTNKINDYPFGIMYWNSDKQYIQFTIDSKVNIWRTPNSNYLKYQTGKLNLYRYENKTWVDITDKYNQNRNNLSFGDWEIFIEKLPSGTYKFTGNGKPAIDGEWYIETYEKVMLLLQNNKNNNLFSFQEDTFTDLGQQTLTEELYKTKGFDNITLINTLENKQDYKLLMWTDNVEAETALLKYECKPYRPIDRLNDKFKILMYKE